MAEDKETGAVGAKRTSKGLGYFSIGFGLVEVAAARPIARWLGLEGSDTARTTLRAFGAREIAAGVLGLRQPADSKALWNRVAGDFMDVTALGLALRDSEGKGAVAGALAFVGGAMIADVLTARALDRDTGRILPTNQEATA
jgi:hypothetical protein